MSSFRFTLGPNPDWIAGGLDWGDWTQKFHGGRPSWGNESTELRTTDWYRHRDPVAVGMRLT